MGEMTKWAIKLGVGALVSLGITFVSGKMMKRLLSDVFEDMDDDATKFDSNGRIEVSKNDYQVN
jgi:hypothetical protein